MKESNTFIKKIVRAFRAMPRACLVAIVLCGTSIALYAQPPANAQITGLTTTVTPASYQTWVELTNGTTPPPLVVTLGVTVVEAYLGNGTIELPLNYTPNLTTHPTFTYGTDGMGTLESFFTFNATELTTWMATSANTIVASFAVAGDILTITLKDPSDAGYAAGLVNIPLNFSFNSNWEMRVPTGTVMWEVAPVAIVNSVTAQTPTVKQVTGNSTGALAVNASNRYNPTDEYYISGIISTRTFFNNNYYYRIDLDPAYQNMVWIEILTGSTPETALTNYFKDGLVMGPNVDPAGGTVPTGYTRYYRFINPHPTDLDHADYNEWHYGGQLNDNRRGLTSQSSFTPPVMANGFTFDIRWGVSYQPVNGIPQNRTTSFNYIKADRNVWDLYMGIGLHLPSNTAISFLTCGLQNGAVTRIYTQANYNSYSNEIPFKNIGSGAITGVSFTLYQQSITSAKLNYNTVNLYATRDGSDAANLPPWCAFRVEYVVKNALTNVTRMESDAMGVWVPTNATNASQNQTLTLPALGVNEYIDQIIVIPMGTDGVSEGVWSGQTSFCLYYYAKAWDNRLWPNGTAVPLHSEVPMGWTLTYNDNPDKPLDYPIDYDTNPVYAGYKEAIREGNTASHYYTDAPYALANATSSNANGVAPGNIVNYTITGYNSSYGIGREVDNAGWWINPRVMLRVPKFMELIGLVGALPGTSTMLSGTTASDGTHVPAGTFSVTATLESTNTISGIAYNYYSFQITGYKGRGNQLLAMFNIPVQFHINNTARPGTYALRVLVSDGDAANFYESVKHLTLNASLGSGETKSNYGLGVNDNYHRVTTYGNSLLNIPASTSVTVLSLTSIAVKTDMSTPSTGGSWVTADVVPAEPNSQAQVRLTLTNNGTTDLTNIRLYDIIPYNGDPLGSTGGVTFNNVTASVGTPTVYYSTNPNPQAQLYGLHGGPDPDLQTTNFWSGWTTTNPGATTTAIVINFGTQELAPGESLSVIITFDIPAGANQTAYNQFLYSVVEKTNSTNKINMVSGKAGFSTEAIGIAYDANLPTVVATPDGLLNLPDALTAIIGFAPAQGPLKDSLYVDLGIPTLTGYTFAGWDTHAAGDGDSYNPGDGHQFTAGTTLTLFAQWTPKTYTITYNKNNAAATGSMSSETATFGQNFTLTANSFALSGSDFMGWNTKADGTGANYTDAQAFTPWMDTTNLVLYARWSDCRWVLFSAGTTKDQTICLGSAITPIVYLVGKTITDIEVASTGLPTGVNYIWSAAKDTITISGTPTAAGISNYTLVPTGYCVADTAKGTITVKPLAVANDINAVNDTICTGGNSTLTVSSAIPGAVFKWYATQTSTVSLNTGTTLPLTALTADTTFYIGVSGTGYCENATGTRKAISVKVKEYAVAADITAVNDSICPNTTASLTANAPSVTAPVYKWYDGQGAGATLLYTGKTLTTTALTADTIFYISVSGSNYCENIAGTRKEVKAVVKMCKLIDCDSSPRTVTEDGCGVGYYSKMDASWNITPLPSIVFDSVRYIVNSITRSSGITATLSGVIFTTGMPQLVECIAYKGTITDTCKFLVTVEAIPVAVVSDLSVLNDLICAGKTAMLTATSALSNPVFRWYDSQSATATLLWTGATYTTSALSSDTTFYVSVSNTGHCEIAAGNRLVSTVTIVPPPVPPVITVNPLPALQGMLVDLSAAVNILPGITYTYYANADGTGKLPGSTVTYNPPKNDYYVSASNGACESDLSQIILQDPCPATISDAQGNPYKVTSLGGFCWTENLRATQYADNTPIGFANVYTCPNCPAQLDTIFGLLYDWNSAMGGDICPVGWHVPTQAEWSALNPFPAQTLKSAMYWLNPPGVGTDDYGFDARPAGWYNSALDRFEDLYGYAGWWASDDNAGTTASAFYISYYCSKVEKEIISKANGLSVRCVMD